VGSQDPVWILHPGAGMLNSMSHLKIHHLRQAGLCKRAIAVQVGCSVRTVYTVLAGPPPTQAEIAAGCMARTKPQGRPSRVRTLRDTIEAMLSQKRDLPVTEILRRLHSEHGYTGSDSPVYKLVHQVRPAKPMGSPELRFDGLPGEFVQFDFGQVKIHFRDGTGMKVRFFTGVLKYSRFRHVEIVPDERAETLARGTVACFAAWGGAPKQWVYDNPTTVWYNREQQIAHPYLRQLLGAYNALIEATTPGCPNQKGSVENNVKFVKNGFFLCRSFDNEADMHRQLAEWLQEINHVRRSAATDEIPATRLAHEQERLAARSLADTRENWAMIETSTVMPTGLVRWNGAAYSVPPQYLGAPATLLVREHTIEIDVNGTRCTHPRQDHTGRISRLPEHSLAQVAITTERRKKTYAMRQHLFDMGPAAITFCEQIIMAHPGNGWYPDIHRLYDIAVSTDRDRFLHALTQCLERGDHAVRAVAQTLARQGVAS
jgi:transposase